MGCFMHWKPIGRVFRELNVDLRGVLMCWMSIGSVFGELNADLRGVLCIGYLLVECLKH